MPIQDQLNQLRRIGTGQVQVEVLSPSDEQNYLVPRIADVEHYQAFFLHKFGARVSPASIQTYILQVQDLIQEARVEHPELFEALEAAMLNEQDYKTSGAYLEADAEMRERIDKAFNLSIEFKQFREQRIYGG